jgi:hypothetical protein
MLSSSFRSDQIYKYEKYDFGHTLLCYLSQTWMFNNPVAVILNVDVRLMHNNSATKENYGFGHTFGGT